MRGNQVGDRTNRSEERGGGRGSAKRIKRKRPRKKKRARTYFRNFRMDPRRGYRSSTAAFSRTLSRHGNLVEISVTRRPSRVSLKRFVPSSVRLAPKCVELALSVNFYRPCQRVVPNINSLVDTSVLSILSRRLPRRRVYFLAS